VVPVAVGVVPVAVGVVLVEAPVGVQTGRELVVNKGVRNWIQTRRKNLVNPPQNRPGLRSKLHVARTVQLEVLPLAIKPAEAPVVVADRAALGVSADLAVALVQAT
jgi:hypothetical protein